MTYSWEPDDAFLDDLCIIGGIPVNRRGQFGKRVKVSINNYLSWKSGPSEQEINEAIEYLSKAVLNAYEDIENDQKIQKVISRKKALPEYAVTILQEGVHNLPSNEEIFTKKTRRKSLELISGATSFGAIVKPGRKRPRGKQSRPFLQRRLKKLNKGKGQPKKITEMFLVGGLMDAYTQATGKTVFVRWNSDNPGPFIEMADFIYEEISRNTDLKMTGPEHIVREILKRIKEDKKNQEDN